MKKLLGLLSGNKTYIVAAVVAIATFAKMVGWITAEEFISLTGFLAAIGLYTVRQAIKKLE